jgi:uncharacterized membrane-anchored protein
MHKLLFAALFCLALGSANAAPDNDAGTPQKAGGDRLAVLLHAPAGQDYPARRHRDPRPAGEFPLPRPADSARLLEAWGNPPGTESLGMIVPAGVNPMSPESWGVVITYDKDGHVKDDDADGIDYAKLLKEMQEGLAGRAMPSARSRATAR